MCGGLGLLLGDGNLSYGRFWNPGYNRDRGPVFAGAVRLHLEGALFVAGASGGQLPIIVGLK